MRSRCLGLRSPVERCAFIPGFAIANAAAGRPRRRCANAFQVSWANARAWDVSPETLTDCSPHFVLRSLFTLHPRQHAWDSRHPAPASTPTVRVHFRVSQSFCPARSGPPVPLHHRAVHWRFSPEGSCPVLLCHFI